MFILDYFKKWFQRKPETTGTDVDPLAAAALTTDTTRDAPMDRNAKNSSDKPTSFDDGYDSNDSDFDMD